MPRVRLDNKLLNEFSFFEAGGASGGISEFIKGGDEGEEEPFWINDLRLHLSAPFASDQELVIKLSSIQGSAHDFVFISQTIAGNENFQFLPDSPDDKGLRFNSGDTFDVLLPMVSGTNTWGLQINGWAVAS